MKIKELHDSTKLRPGDILYLAYDAWHPGCVWAPVPRIVVILDLDGGGRTRSHGNKMPGFVYSVIAADDGERIINANEAQVRLNQSMSHENFSLRCAKNSYIIDHV